MAKLIIHFINDIASVINNDPACRGWPQVAFLADYNVKLGEKVCPAADLSGQISSAGLETSGTGNMKIVSRWGIRSEVCRDRPIRKQSRSSQPPPPKRSAPTGKDRASINPATGEEDSRGMPRA